MGTPDSAEIPAPVSITIFMVQEHYTIFTMHGNRLLACIFLS